MSRERTITTKVETRFGSLYSHVSHVGQRVTEVRFSSPGKFADTTMGEMLDKIGDAVTESLEQISQRPTLEECLTGIGQYADSRKHPE